MKGRTLDVRYTVSSLKRKGCIFSTIQPNLDEAYFSRNVINLSKVKNFGNGSYGLLDFLINHQGYTIDNSVVNPHAK